LWELADIESRQAKERETFAKLMRGQLTVDASGQVVDKDDTDSDTHVVERDRQDENDDFDREFGEGDELVQMDVDSVIQQA